MSSTRIAFSWRSAAAHTGSAAKPKRNRSPRRSASIGLALALVVPALLAAVVPVVPARASTDHYLLMPRSELLSLPTSGRAWSALKTVADGSWGKPDLCDEDVKHGTKVLAGALVFARTGAAGYDTKTRNAIVSAMGTERNTDCGVLSIGRQLGAYVLAADFVRLNDGAFRSWLSGMRTRVFTGHSRWQTLVGTHSDSANNWGAFAGASRIAASLFLGDTEDVARAAKVLRGFLGDRGAWNAFRGQSSTVGSLGDTVSAWACDASPDGFVPINPACTRSGINLEGAIVNDVSRDDLGLTWPVGPTGIGYTLESLQGLMLQTELLYRNGYGGAWGWSSSALRQAAGLVTRNGLAGGPTWNRSTVSHHVPWLLNLRYGLRLPTRPADYGRTFGYTDWLYGPRGGSPDTTSPQTPRSTFTGNGLPNLLVGTSWADTIYGKAGNDVLYGKGGRDMLSGGAGQDKIFGGGGSDMIRGNRRRDRLVGGPGSDTIHGGRGPDIINVAGDGAADTVDCGRGRDIVYYSAGDATSNCELKIKL